MIQYYAIFYCILTVSVTKYFRMENEINHVVKTLFAKRDFRALYQA